MNRRDFLTLAASATASLAAGSILSACGGGASAPSAAPASPSQAEKPAASSSQAAKPAASQSQAAKPAASQSQAAASPAAATSANAGAKPSLKVVYVVAAATQSPVWLADATGAFAKRGVNVSLQYIDSAVSLKALIAKEIDVVIQSAAQLITADLNGQADLVYIGSSSNHAQGELLTESSIKTASDLKGKTIGNDKPGTALDYYTQLALKLLGLKTSDVTLRTLGGSDVLVQALASGQIQGASMTPPQSLQAEAQGYNPLKNTYSEPYQGSGPIIQRGRLKDLSAALVPFLAGMRDGIVAFNNQPDLAKSTIAKYAKIDDPTVLERTYEFHKTSNPFQLDLKPTTEGIQAMLDFLAPKLPAAKTAKPEQFMDLSLLAQVPAT